MAHSDQFPDTEAGSPSLDLGDSARVLLRRWRIVLLGAVLTLLAAGAGIFLVPTNYQASGQFILLLPPQSTGASSPTNPYLNLEPGLSVTASLIASSLMTKQAERDFEAAGFTSAYAIALDPGVGPVLQVSVEDTDPVMAVRTRDEVIRRLEVELLRMQQEVSAPSRQLIHGRINGAPNVADPLPGSKIRALAVIGAVGVLSTFLVAFGVDRRRRPPRHGTDRGAPDTAVSPMAHGSGSPAPPVGARTQGADHLPGLSAPEPVGQGGGPASSVASRELPTKPSGAGEADASGLVLTPDRDGWSWWRN